MKFSVKEKEDNLTKGFGDITRTSAPSILQNNMHLQSHVNSVKFFAAVNTLAHL